MSKPQLFDNFINSPYVFTLHKYQKLILAKRNVNTNLNIQPLDKYTNKILPNYARRRRRVTRSLKVCSHKPVQIKNRVEIQIKVLLTYTLFNLEQQINKSALNSLQFTTIST